MSRLTPAVAVLLFGGCASGGPVIAPGVDPADEGGSVEARPTAPWSAPALAASAVPAVYLEEWRAAENRESCVLIAPEGMARDEATPRRATFSGGWAVAYDLPDVRSAYGVAGSGATVHGDVYDDWPHRIEWSDGSWAGYGPEGGTGPNQLAYLRMQGQDCLYNVWSRLGTTHLESLLASLRFVRVD